jgi:hypothetical protein
MRRRKNYWLAYSLALLLAGAPVAGACSTEPDSLRWEVRLNKYRLLEGTAGEDLSCRIPILRHSDTLWVQFSTTDTAHVKHLVEVVDDHGVSVHCFSSGAVLSEPMPLPIMPLFVRRTFLQGSFELRYLDSRGHKQVLARLYIVGTD